MRVSESDEAELRHGKAVEAKPPSPAIEQQSITVTRTLEVKPATPLSSKSDNGPPAGPRSYVQGAVAHGYHPLATSSVSQLLLPTIPTLSSIDLNEPVRLTTPRPPPRPKTAPSPSSVAEQPRPPPKLPPFMQSRRWAAMCETARPQTSAHDRAVSEETRTMTLREVSFEQQRAAPKRHLPVDTPQSVNENESVASTEGLCRPISLPTWQLVRMARGTRGSSQSTNSVFRKLTMHRSGASPKHSKRQSVEKPLPRLSRSSQMGRKRAVSDLRRRAGTGHKRNVSSPVVNLDGAFPGPLKTGRRSSSPVPSLHDPEKAKRFSEECEALLTNKDFEKDFLSPPAASIGNATSASREAAVAQNTSKQTKEDVVGEAKPAQCSPSSSLLAAPHPPVRTSSKGDARLATMVHMTKILGTPAVTSSTGDALVVSDVSSNQSAGQRAITQSQHSQIPCRMASAESTDTKKTNRARAAKSTDTLALIEAQIRDPVNFSRDGQMDQKFEAGLPHHKKLGPAGTPPERPLPDLPTTRPTSPSSLPVRASSVLSIGSTRRSLLSPLSEPERNRSTTAVDVGSCQGSIPILPKGLAIKHLDEDRVGDPAPTSPSSIYSQTSQVSGQSTKHKFVRHDKSVFRAARITEVRRRIQADRDREQRISEESERPGREEHNPVNIGLDPPLPFPSALKEQSSLDQLDQFPPVPASRPASRTSHNSATIHRPHSRTRSHVRQSSKASSRYSYRHAIPRGQGGQILATSQIKVLVDTDPVTGNFRAGAMTPEPSPIREAHSPEHTPIKPSTLRTIRPAKLPSRIDENEQVNDVSPRKKTSTRSLRSHTSAVSGRHSMTGSRQSARRPSSDVSHLESSDDEDVMPFSVGKNGKRKLRRRWNSNDIRTVQMMYNDFEDIYESLMQKEREVQQQRDEIQRMIRVFAASSRGHGLRGVMFPAERLDFADQNVTLLDDTRSLHTPNIARNVTRGGQAPSVMSNTSAVRLASPARKGKHVNKSLSEARLDAASDALDTVIKARPVSNISSASATTDLSRGSGSSKENSAAEGSMTDPYEYDVGPAKALEAATLMKDHGPGIREKGGSETPDYTGRPQSRGTAKVSLAKSRDAVPLHHPPPVAVNIPRGALSEEEEEEDDSQGRFSNTTVAKRSAAMESALAVPRSASAASGDSSPEEKRLSVNHVLTRTEEMDRMLNAISLLG
ncbi:uncharacterized protein HMPREF1541_05025 [Cyphellophora europaea CBS 101466]|uniref:Uncharacterized protein n=1 Tax=Cyphellophora europaea (strain CBS 101466) TaxID=1220924 RepID=W2RWN8_CYPE1|nr:uncharacterized protein HMPREF1541_05025 [Cyphellophora europaea CBS 101466]ETN40745.1 hypothetical protein HMPREF1541_05025 [Cyphellophora europaea CBS 101466]